MVGESKGTWASAEGAPGTAALNAGGACASIGNCSTGGFYKDGTGHYQPFLVNETARLRR